MGKAIYTAALLLYYGAAASCLYLAWVRPSTRRRRVLYVLAVLVLFGYIPLNTIYNDWQHERYREAAYAHFKKRCAENSGEKIHRVVENVEGIFLAKPRIPASDASLRDQYWMGDPYGYSQFEAKYPAETFLFDRSGKTISSDVFTPITGFAFVEMPNPNYDVDKNVSPYLRFKLRAVEQDGSGSVVQKKLEPVAEPVSALRSRYGMTWADISTTEDRRYWVAGGVLTVFDLHSNRPVAERIGYVIDPQLGAISQGRRIWLHVNHLRGAFCPPFEAEFDKNKEFVAKVLKSSRVVSDGK